MHHVPHIAARLTATYWQLAKKTSCTKTAPGPLQGCYKVLDVLITVQQLAKTCQSHKQLLVSYNGR